MNKNLTTMTDHINQAKQQMVDHNVYGIHTEEDLEAFKRQHEAAKAEGLSYFYFNNQLVANMLFDDLYQAYSKHFVEQKE